MRARLDFDRVFFKRETAILLGVAAALAVGGIAIAQTNLAHAPLGRTASWFLLVFAIATSLGAITLFVSMWLYWVKCDSTSRWYRGIWFFVLVLGLFSGAPQVLYYLIVYLPAVRNKLQRRNGEQNV